MLKQRNHKSVPVLTAATATGAGNTVVCTDQRNIIVAISAASTPTLTIKCQGSIGSVAPTWGSSASASNVWDYVQMIDLQDGSSISGDTGVSFTGTADLRLFEVNTNGLDFVTFNVTSRSAGSATVVARLFNNQ